MLITRLCFYVHLYLGQRIQSIRLRGRAPCIRSKKFRPHNFNHFLIETHFWAKCQVLPPTWNALRFHHSRLNSSITSSPHYLATSVREFSGGWKDRELGSFNRRTWKTAGVCTIYDVGVRCPPCLTSGPLSHRIVRTRRSHPLISHVARASGQNGSRTKTLAMERPARSMTRCARESPTWEKQNRSPVAHSIKFLRRSNVSV